MNDDLQEEIPSTERIEIGLLLEGIYQQYGYDFRNYTLSSIRRRIWHRIQTDGLTTISSLQEKVLHDQRMMEKLFHDFSINVTEMFRDPEFFLTFRKKVIPLIKNYPYVRIWHAGCASGEEVFSMAILLHEEGIYHKTRIYATDMNENILQRAKKGVIPLRYMQAYTNNYVRSGGTSAFSEYYTAKDNHVCLNPFLIKNIVFAQHNLVTDGSFNEFHVIICRNVMIYFNRSLQERVYQLFYDSLSTPGFLGLGSKEAIQFTTQANRYEEVTSNEKIYRKMK
jgi:chemotaxis protein methyltransferase CheR